MQTNKQVELFYWLGDNPNYSGTDQWVKAKTPDDKNAVISFDFEHKINMPAKAKVVLSNTIPNFLASDADSFTGHLSTLASGSDSGTQSPLFTDFMRVILVDAHSKLVLISGRIYDVQQEYNGFQGYSTTLEIKDELEMLRGVYVDEIGDVSVTSSTERSDVIKDSLINSDAWAKPSEVDIAIDISDTGTNPEDRLQTSAGTYPATDKIKFSRSSANVLQEINNISQEDPISTEDSDKIAANYGYDYYLDANFASVDNSGADTRTPPSAHFNYFKRGDRPNNGNSPQTYGLSIEFPTGSGFAKTGQKLPMLTNFDFERPKYEVFTDATVTGVRVDKGRVSKNFELLNVTSITQGGSSANFKWAGTEFDKNTDTTLVDGTGAAELLDLYTADGSSLTTAGVCRVQYQSTESGDGYILISDTKSTFPQGAGQVRLVGATTGAHCLLVPSTGRFRNKFPGVKRTFKTQWGGEGTNDALRRKMATQLSRAGVTGDEIVRGSFNISQFPYYHVDNTMSGSDSATTVTWTNFADSAKDVRKYGLKPSMPIGILDSNGGHFSHYNYTTAVSSTTATVAAAPQNLSGSTANFSASSQTIRFYVPIRAGDFIYVKNHIENIAGNFLVTKVSYNESPGIQNARLEVVGKDTAIAGKVAKANAPNVSGDGKGTDDIIAKGALSFSFPTGASNTRVVFSSTDNDTVAWTAGPILLGNGEQYQIAAGNTGDMTAYASTGTDAQKAATSYKLYWAEDDEDAIRIVTQADWDPTADTIDIGWARADSDGNGKAEFMINGTNPDGQSFGLTTEIHSPANSVSIDGDGITIREGTSSDSFLSFLKGTTTISRLFANHATANATTINSSNIDGSVSFPTVLTNGSSTANTNFQMFFPNNNSVMQIGSGGNFHFRPHTAGATLGSSTKEWTNIFGGDNIVPEGSGVRVVGNLECTGNLTVGGSGGGGSAALDDITTGDAASTLATSAGNITIDAQGDNTDIIFKGTDGGADITMLTMDASAAGQLLAKDGSQSLPTYGFASDIDTGFYYYSAGFAGITGGGVASLAVGGGNCFVSGNYTFINDANTGMAGASDVLQLFAGGTTHLSVGGAVTGATLQVSANVVEMPLAGSTNAQLKLRSRDTSDDLVTPPLAFRDDTHTGIFSDASDQMSFAVGAAKMMTLDEASSNSSVGIGYTTSIGTNLHESGFALKVTGDFKVDGDTTKTSSGGDWDNVSDDRIKQNVASITTGTNVIKQLNPISFKFKDEWKATSSGIETGTVFGFLASEYETVFPNNVKTGNDLIKLSDNTYTTAKYSDSEDKSKMPDGAEVVYQDIKSINTGGLMPHVIAAIKELDARITSLEGG